LCEIVMKLTELFSATGEPFSYYPGFVERFGISVNSTVLLCYIAWKTFPDELDGWKPISSESISKATGLSVKEQATARKQLVQAGLVEEYYARLKHSLMFRLLKKEVIEKWPFAERADAQTPKGQMAIIPNGVSSIQLEGNRRELDKTTEVQKPEVLAASVYEAYPRKVSRPKAIAAINAASERCKIDLASLLEKTKQMAGVWSGASKADLAFCPHPTTWFNQERFNDDPSTWRSRGFSATQPARKSITEETKW
jgi:hypothetical protein